MEIFTEITDLTQRFSKIVVALGTFDGVHLGHKKIISRAVELAQSIGGTSVVFTFSNHPLSVIAPARRPLQIIEQDYKAQLIADMGVNILLTIPFTAAFAKLTPDEFLTVLIEKLSPQTVVVGPNYSFGYKSAGTPDYLIEAGKKRGFGVEILDVYSIDDTTVSSTVIRGLITKGRVGDAARLLGRLPRISGVVITGKQRGQRVLNHPTANLDIGKGMAIPCDGVYAVVVYANRMKYGGVANIGNNPTFRDANRHIEVNMFDFDGDLYGQKISVDFVKRLRGERTFANPDELKKQILRDVQQAKQLFQNVE